MEEQRSFVRMQKPLPQHWTNIAIGRSNFHLSANVNSQKKLISIWLNIQGEKAKEHFDELYKRAKEQSEKEISTTIQWDRLDDKKMCVVHISTSADFTDKNDWNNQCTWFKENLEKFTRFFKPIIAEL